MRLNKIKVDDIPIEGFFAPNDDEFQSEVDHFDCREVFYFLPPNHFFFPVAGSTTLVCSEVEATLGAPPAAFEAWVEVVAVFGFG